jgi:dCTP deaminase
MTVPSGAAESAPLSDSQILRRLTMEPGDRALVVRPLVDPDQIGATTVDLRLGTEWEVLRPARFSALDPGDDEAHVSALLDASVEEFRLTTGQNQGLVLHPGELILALTLEYLQLPDDLWGNLEGRSTWARIGLQVHASAGMVDCGFSGYLTLELQNTGRLPMVLYPGLRVAQIAFFPVGAVLRPYGGRTAAAYSDQTTARTAFPRQHEHRALRRYLKNENEQELQAEDEAVT